MCASNILIGTWASGLWQNLGEPTTVSALTISGYTTQPSTVGQVNNLVNTCFTPTGLSGVYYDVTPDYSPDILNLVGLMYQVSFFNQMAIRTMGQGGDTTPWQRLKEADSDISRASITNIGKEYREMSRVANAQLNYAINAYLTNSGIARDVSFLNMAYASNNPYGTAGGIYQ